MKFKTMLITFLMLLLVSSSVLATEDTENRRNLILGSAVVGTLMLIIAFNLDETHKILKFGIILIVLFMLRIITSISTFGNGSTGVALLKLYDRSLYVVIGWFIFYFLFEVILRPFAQKKGWIKKREND